MNEKYPKGRYWIVKLAPKYAVFQGLFLSGISAALDARFPGIALFYLISIGMSFFGVQIPSVNEKYDRWHNL